MKSYTKVLLYSTAALIASVIGYKGSEWIIELRKKPLIEYGNYESHFKQASSRIILYSNSTCVYCKKTKELLNFYNLDYLTYEIDKSQEAKEQFEKMNSDTVPVLLIGDKKINGFSEAAMKDIFNNYVRTQY